MTKKLAELNQEAEQATSHVRTLTWRTARQTTEAEALIAEGMLMLERAEAMLAEQKKKSGLRRRVIVPAPVEPAEPAASSDRQPKAESTNDDD